MITQGFRKVSILLALCAMVVSCDKETSTAPGFDRGPLLENLGVNIIVPAYDSLARRAARWGGRRVLAGRRGCPPAHEVAKTGGGPGRASAALGAGAAPIARFWSQPSQDSAAASKLT